MKEPEEWETYRVKDAANITGLPANEIIRMGANGKLRLWIWHGNGPTMNGDYQGWAQIPPDSLKSQVNRPIDSFYVKCSKFITPKGRLFETADFETVITPTGSIAKSSKAIPTRVEISIQWLRIWPDDLKRLVPGKTASKPTRPIRKPGIKNRLTYSLENARGLLITRNGKEPTATEVINSLKIDDPTGAVIDFSEDEKGFYLLWVDLNDKHHRARRRNIENHLSIIRKENNNLS